MFTRRTAILFSALPAALAANLCPAGGNVPDWATVRKVADQQFDVVVEIDDGGKPIDSMTLWATIDGGQSWKEAGTFDHQVEAFRYEARVQGFHGFYAAAGNELGVSAPPPDSTTTPDYWVFVDFTAPVVQIREVEIRRQGSPIAHITWAAFDNDLKDRPVDLTYRGGGGNTWHTLANSIANTGAYDWRMPANLPQRITVRVTARDRTGHATSDESDPVVLRVKQPTPPAPIATTVSDPGRLFGRPTKAQPRTGLGSEMERALSLVAQGKAHSRRGENLLAQSRFRDALALQPELTEALEELGRVLYAQNEMPRSIEAYRLALQQKPTSRAALEGVALAHIAERRFDPAAEYIERIVRQNPADARAWLNLGDIAVYRGDEIRAREYYDMAMTADATDAKTIEMARGRLKSLPQLASEFRQTHAER